MPVGRFYRYAQYLADRFGSKTYRLSVDAGFSCPVRDAGRPCRYCFEDGSRAPYLGAHADLAEQISAGSAFLRRRYRAQQMLLYFQAYSSTHAPVDRLRAIYDRGLATETFAGLVVSTRPDCLDPAKADLLASYQSTDFEVWVELGLQSAHDATLRRVDRGHSVARFLDAYRLLKARGIRVGVHLMAGLPGEGEAEFLQTTRFVADLRPDGVKFHNLVVVERTPIFDELLAGAIAPFGLRRYVRYLARAIELLPPTTVVLRLGFDPPRGVRSVPSGGSKQNLYAAVEAELERRDSKQASRWTLNDG